MSTPHDVHEALDRLARAADSDPGAQLLAGIRTEARRHRNRTVAAATASLAAVVVVGYAAWAATSGADTAREPDYTGPTSAAPTPSPTPSETEPAVDLETLATRKADVDGDGAEDRVRLLVPRGSGTGDPAEETWLRVETATGSDTVQVTDAPAYVGFYDTTVVDLDGTGGDEILVFETGGGESGALSVWTWSDGFVRAEPAAGTPAYLVDPAGLASGGEELGVAYQDGHLLTWQALEPGSQEVSVWQWFLADDMLTAVVLPGTQCVSLGVVEPC